MHKTLKKIGLVIADIAIVNIALILSLLIKFDGSIPSKYINIFPLHGICISLVFVIIFYFSELYKSLWQFASVMELLRLLFASLTATLISAAAEFALQALPLSVLINMFLFALFSMTFLRLSYRFTRRLLQERSLRSNQAGQKRAMIVGAGEGGNIIIREMRSNRNINSKPVIIIDDDRNKQGEKMLGVPIVGGVGTIPENAKKYNIDEIIFTIISIDADLRNKILQICSETGCALLIMDSPAAFFNKKGDNVLLRPVNIDDLLGREQVNLDIRSIAGYLSGKTILITGGGGSIGSEIARQLIKFKIKKLVLLDNYENNVYYLNNELRSKKFNGDITVETVIASIRERDRLDEIFRKHEPDIVFHAAAHKHVPLMEENPGEAVKNNIMGTYNVAELSDKYHVERFVLISTDKAVNPTSIMGATKRIAEMLIQAIDRRSQTKYITVRFGNVMGSNGSVIPLFKKQIENGGPVTVTHPKIERYFMTIPEASQLVLQAGALAEGGEVFVLDMGKPIKIIDLARNMIRLSGMVPDKDIKIEIIGLRPGEKLFEELFYDDYLETKHQRIFAEKPSMVSYDGLLDDIMKLILVTEHSESIREAITKILPQYKYKRKDKLNETDNINETDNLIGFNL